MPTQEQYSEGDATRVILLSDTDDDGIWKAVQDPTSGGGGGGGLTDAELRATPVDVTVIGEVEIKNDSGSAIPVSGTLAVTQSGSWTIIIDAASLAALETINAVQSGTWTVELSATALAALETIELGATTLAALETISAVQSGTWTVVLDATSLAALETVTVLQGTSPWVIGDGGGSITVDGTVAATLSEPISVDDNGGSLTVDNADLTSLLLEMQVMNGAMAMQVDDATVGVGTTYQGWAAPGALTSAASWRIRRIVDTGAADTDTSITFADGNRNFDNIWDNRAALSYS